MDIQALKELADKVEAGDWNPYATPAPKEINESLVLNCYSGSLDAAKSLHDAVLTDYGWEVYRTAKYPGMIPGSCPSAYKAIVGWGSQISGHADNPARAWLLAILRALIAENR